MKRLTTLLAASLFAAAATAADGRLPAAVDLDRYAGTWYEIARMPMFFQRKCARDVTATYTRAADHVRVVNRCVKEDGETMTAEGKAYVTDAPTNRRLAVGFFEIFGWMPFTGDYWILDIDPDYRWVIVGHPNRKYGWILSRTPAIDAALRADLDHRLTGLGYDAKAFVTTRQTAR